MDIRKLDLNLLLTLEMLFEERNVSAAARRLGVSQPTVSFALGKARSFFGDELFVRARSGISPTPLAMKLRPAISRVIETVQGEILQPWSFDPSDSERLFSIAGYDVGALASLPPILRALRERAPKATLRWLSIPENQLRDAMEDGRVDLALGYFATPAGSGLCHEKLFMHPFVCLVRKGHPTIDGTLTLEQFLATDHLEVSRDDLGPPFHEKVLAAHGNKHRVRLYTQEFLAVPNLIAESDMISIVPMALALTCRNRSDIQVLPPPIEIPSMEIDLFWHRRVQNEPAVVWLRTLITEMFKDRDPSRDALSGLFAAGVAPADA